VLVPLALCIGPIISLRGVSDKYILFGKLSPVLVEMSTSNDRVSTRKKIHFQLQDR
jgi:hypothetical protein